MSRSLAASDRAIQETVYGARALSSNYEFMSAEMQETASEIGLLQPRKKNLRAMLLLMLKPTYKATAVYQIAEGRMRGFQVGDPKAREMVRLLLFDEKDREFDLWIRGPKTGEVLTQEQVNGVVASVRPPA